MFTAQPYINDLDGRTRVVLLPLGAGADFLFQTPDGYLWDFLSLDAKFTTSAAAGNRTPTFIVDDGANRIWQDQAPVQAAGATVDYLLGEGISRDVTLAAFIKLAAPTDLRLLAGWRLRVSTVNLDAGDLWVCTMMVREFQLNAPSGPRASARRISTRFAAPRRPGRAY